jgi:hypothetical protein
MRWSGELEDHTPLIKGGERLSADLQAWHTEHLRALDARLRHERASHLVETLLRIWHRTIPLDYTSYAILIRPSPAAALSPVFAPRANTGNS